MTREQAGQQLCKLGQEQLLQYYDQLEEQEQRELLEQISAIDFTQIERASKQEAKGKITPIPAMTRPQILKKEKEYREEGERAIEAGQVAAVLLAGGMGTRLGSDAPKGMYDIGKTRSLTIFQCLMEQLMKIGRGITLFIMTSEKNHEATKAFFEEKEYFGYPKDQVFFFQQEMAPATDYAGKVLLENKGRVATSPNGNGGWFRSMERAGLMEVIKERNIQWLNVFAVDNVLQKMADPLFVGAVIKEGMTSGSKVIKKANPDEKVGVICLEDGQPSIVEYYELTDEMRQARDEEGEYAYQYGVILNYLFRVDCLLKLIDQQLPLHVVEKKIPCLDKNGQEIQPAEPNGHKYETLILDMIHQMKDTLPFEVIREEEFAPIKNKTGVDSVESAQKLLEKNGVVL